MRCSVLADYLRRVVVDGVMHTCNADHSLATAAIEATATGHFGQDALNGEPPTGTTHEALGNRYPPSGRTDLMPDELTSVPIGEVTVAGCGSCQLRRRPG